MLLGIKRLIFLSKFMNYHLESSFILQMVEADEEAF